METDSKLGMIAGLAVVLAIAVLAKPKASETPEGGPPANAARPRAAEPTPASLASQPRQEVPARVVPFVRSAVP